MPGYVSLDRFEDEAQRDRIQAKNSLEAYCFNMKATLEDSKFKDKVIHLRKGLDVLIAKECLNFSCLNQITN